MDYDQAGPELASTTALWAGGLFDPQYPLEHLGGLALQTGDRLRALGLFALLGHADLELFCANLSRSACAWRYFLQRVVAAGATDSEHHFASGRLAPWWDAVAAGDLEMARDIASLAPREKHGRSEYEDDYCYAQLLFAILGDEARGGRVDELMARWSEFQDGAPSPRADLCAALLAKDADAFAPAFDGLLQAFDLEGEQWRARREDETPESSVRREVCVEGLCLLRLAERRGLPTRPEYPYCPGLARGHPEQPFPRDFLVRT